MGVVSRQLNSSRQVGKSSILAQQQSSHHHATGSTTEPQSQQADASDSPSRDVPEVLAALLAIVKDEWEWANGPGGGVRLPDVASNAAAHLLLPDSPGAIFKVKEGAAAMRDHRKHSFLRSSDGDSSTAGQLRARYGRDSSRPVSPARSTVQYSSSTASSSKTSRARGSELHASSSSSTSNTSRTATSYTCSSSSSSSYASPTRTHPTATSYSRYGSPPRSTGQLNRSSSVSVRRSISPGKTAAGFGSSSSTCRTVGPSRNLTAYSTRSTGSPSRGTPAGRASSCSRSGSLRSNLSPTRGATAHPQVAVLPCAAAAAASSETRNTSGQRAMQQVHSTVLRRVAESCASAYECVVPEALSSNGGVSVGGNSTCGDRGNDGGGRSNSGKSWRSSEVHQISFGGYIHAHAASQLIFVPEHQGEASGIDQFSCQSNLDKHGEVQNRGACSISNRGINDNFDCEASLSCSHAAAAVSALADQVTLDRRNVEQQAAVNAAAMFDFKLPPPIRTRSNPSDILSASAPSATSSFSAAGREPAALPRVSANGAAATAAASSNSRRQTAQQQQQPMSRAGSVNSSLSTCSKTQQPANGGSSRNSVSAGGLASCSKTADACQHANIGEQQQEHQVSDSETSMLNPLFSNSNTPKNLSCSGSVPGTGSTGSRTEAVPCCNATSCSIGGTDQTELRHRLSQSAAAAAAAAESALMGKQEAPASPPNMAVPWSHESDGDVQGKELTSVAAYLAGGNMRIFDTAFSKGPNTASFKTPAARSSPKQQDASTTWVQRLAGSRTTRDSNGSQHSHQSHTINVSNNPVCTLGSSSTGSKASMGSGNGSPVGSSVGSHSSYANGPPRVTAASSASQGFAGGLKDRSGTGGGGKYKRRLLLVVPLLMLLAALGVGAWAWVSVFSAEKGMHAAAAAGVAATGPALTFRVVVTVPSVEANQGCGRWFNGNQRIRDYQQLVSAAYSKTLNLPLPENPVISITCGGSVVFGVSPYIAASEDAPLLQSIEAADVATQVAAAAAAPATQSLTQTSMYASRLRNRDVAAGRMLLQQFFKAYPATVEVETVFAVPDKFSAADQRADLVERILSTSAETLAQPSQQFFGVPVIMVKAVELQAAQQSDLHPVAASRTAAANLTMSNATSAFPISSTVSAASMAPPTTSSKPYSNIATAQLTPEQGQANQEDWSGSQGPGVPWENVNGTHQFTDYKSALTCTFQPTKSNRAADLQGRLWSWLNGVECVFRAPATEQAVAAMKPAKFDRETAVLCDDVPNEHNSVIDDSGTLWGRQNGVSCAFRLYGKGSKPAEPDTVAQRVPAASFEDMQEHLPSRVSTVWESAPMCTFAPNDSNTVPDTFGRLWGWENNGSCAFSWEPPPN